MNILFIQETDWLERGPHQQHHLAERLSTRGHKVRVVDYEFLWKGNAKKELYSKRQVFSGISKICPDADISIIRPGIVKIPVLEYISLLCSHISEIKRQVKEFVPDVIIGWSILNSYLASYIANRHKIPFIYYWIDVLHKLIPSKLFQPLGKFFEINSLKRSNKVILINKKLQEYVIRLGVPVERTHVIGAGIDNQSFDPDRTDKSLRVKYKLSDNNLVLFFMGWLYSFSGLKEVALELVNNKYKNVRLLIVGEGDLYDELKRIRDEYKLNDSIILTGKRPYTEIPSLVTAADICILPAHPLEPIMQDIVPIKLYEYMAMEKPVITTRLPGIMKEFGNDSGVVYVEKSEDVIDKAILLAKNGQLENLGRKARRFVAKNSWDSVTDKFENILMGISAESK
ncbi:glycosyltransferase family 4 protein [Chloroflexota bacterium]